MKGLKKPTVDSICPSSFNATATRIIMPSTTALAPTNVAMALASCVIVHASSLLTSVTTVL
jgi:hypothetical protein